MLQTNEPGTKPRRAVHFAGEQLHPTSVPLRYQYLTARRGVAPNLAKLVGDLFFGEVSDV